MDSTILLSLSPPTYSLLISVAFRVSFARVMRRISNVRVVVVNLTLLGERFISRMSRSRRKSRRVRRRSRILLISPLRSITTKLRILVVIVIARVRRNLRTNRRTKLRSVVGSRAISSPLRSSRRSILRRVEFYLLIINILPLARQKKAPMQQRRPRIVKLRAAIVSRRTLARRPLPQRSKGPKQS